MTEQTRARAGRRPRRSASQLFIAALVVFGIAASVLLLFSENVQWLRVGLVSALWAAIVGAFAMTKYRRDAVADQTKAKDLQTVYELQLAREISARREYELGVEARVRSEVQLETSEVAALRAELAHLRNNLQMLFDGNLPTERVALRAEATRMQELGGGRNYDGYQPAPSGLYVPGGGTPPQQTERPEYAPSDDSAAVAGIATPYDEPVTAETSVLYPDAPIGSEPPAGYAVPSSRGANRRPQPRVPGNGRRVPTPPRASGPAEPEPAPAFVEYAQVQDDTAGSGVDSYSVGRPRTESSPTITATSSAAPDVGKTGYGVEGSGAGGSGAQGSGAGGYAAAEPAAPVEPAGYDYAPDAPASESSAPVISAPDISAPAVDASDVGAPDIGASDAPAPEAASTEVASTEVASTEAASTEVASTEVASTEAASPDAVAQPDSSASRPAWGDLPEPRPRRRRRAEPETDAASGAHSNGRSVAEILAGMQSGDSEPTERRHRRRAD